MLFSKNLRSKYYSYQGRKISKKISQSKKKLINDFYDRFSFDQSIIQYHNQENTKQKLKFPDQFKKVNIEIGFGNGEFLIKNAISSPNELFIGIEVYLNGIAKVLTEIINLKLDNIILSNLNSFYFLETISCKSVDRIFIINPDPWTKKRHHKRRVMSYETIKLLKKIVKSKNSIFMTTDSVCYIKDTERLLNKYKASFGSYKTCILSENNKLYGISRYQRKAIEKEGKIYLLTL